MLSGFISVKNLTLIWSVRNVYPILRWMARINVLVLLEDLFFTLMSAISAILVVRLVMDLSKVTVTLVQMEECSEKVSAGVKGVRS